MIAPCAYVIDYGERLAFERSCAAQGVVKIYDKIYPFWRDLKRIDASPSNILIPLSSELIFKNTKNTARFSVFLNTNTETLNYKFGCVFVLDTKKLLNANTRELRNGFQYFLNKYAKRHFDKKSLNMLCEAHLETFLAFKNINKGII